MKNILKTTALAFTLLISGFISAHASEIILTPASKLTEMPMPDGVSYVSNSEKISIMAIEMQGTSYEKYLESLKEGVLPGEYVKEKHIIDGNAATMFKIFDEDYGFEMVDLIFGDKTTTVTVNASYPASLSEKRKKEILNTVLSAKWKR